LVSNAQDSSLIVVISKVVRSGYEIVSMRKYCLIIVQKSKKKINPKSNFGDPMAEITCDNQSYVVRKKIVPPINAFSLMTTLRINRGKRKGEEKGTS